MMVATVVALASSSSTTDSTGAASARADISASESHERVVTISGSPVCGRSTSPEPARTCRAKPRKESSAALPTSVVKPPRILMPAASMPALAAAPTSDSVRVPVADTSCAPICGRETLRMPARGPDRVTNRWRTWRSGMSRNTADAIRIVAHSARPGTSTCWEAPASSSAEAASAGTTERKAMYARYGFRRPLPKGSHVFMRANSSSATAYGRTASAIIPPATAANAAETTAPTRASSNRTRVVCARASSDSSSCAATRAP